MAQTVIRKALVMFHATFKSGSLLAALLISTAAHAELTADQVWTNWKAVTASYGQTVTAASETREGDTLVIKGLTIASTFDGGSVNGTIEAVKPDGVQLLSGSSRAMIPSEVFAVKGNRLMLNVTKADFDKQTGATK